MELNTIIDSFTRYLQYRMPDVRNLKVTGMSRIHGGASRETFRCHASWLDQDTPITRALILRRDPEASLIDTEREVEFSAYQDFFPTGIPVPEPIFLETDVKWLEQPFFVMSQIENVKVASPMKGGCYGDHQQKTGVEFWRYLGCIAEKNPEELRLGKIFPAVAAEDVWSQQLDFWVKDIHQSGGDSNIVVQAAIRWLRRNPPPPPEKTVVVHGDYRTGNFLFDDSGEVKAILDWEMCHLGDPHEDIAWAIDPIWSFGREEEPSGLIAKDNALRVWMEHSGLTVNPESLVWWSVFSKVKGLAIWLRAGSEYQSGANTEYLMAFAGWECAHLHTKLLISELQTLRGIENDKS